MIFYEDSSIKMLSSFNIITPVVLVKNGGELPRL